MNDMDEWEQPKSNHVQWTPVRVGNANSNFETQAENLLEFHGPSFPTPSRFQTYGQEKEQGVMNQGP